MPRFRTSNVIVVHVTHGNTKANVFQVDIQCKHANLDYTQSPCKWEQERGSVKTSVKLSLSPRGKLSQESKRG